MFRTRILFSFALIAAVCCSCNDQTDQPTVAEGTDTSGPATAEAPPPRIKNPYTSPDVSPMDMAYFPTNYPQLKMSDSVSKPPVLRVIYSRPHRDGRRIFGQLLQYGQTWRLGANEATEIQVFQPLMIKGKSVKPGRYILYCVPDSSTWTIVFNDNIDSWGLHVDSTKDVVRVPAAAHHTEYAIEYFTIAFEPIEGGAEMIMAWDDVEARLPILFKQ